MTKIRPPQPTVPPKSVASPAVSAELKPGVTTPASGFGQASILSTAPATAAIVGAYGNNGAAGRKRSGGLAGFSRFVQTTPSQPSRASTGTTPSAPSGISTASRASSGSAGSAPSALSQGSIPSAP